jgi:hypothetical protein|tara:strand:+ start:442 stop:1749 length:1308 start_codon:yes stop_codon:yes gene_type:complete
MPNYEFYAQMAQTRANRYEQQYQQAYTAAYRDLMAQYNDEVQVREILSKQLALDKKNNAQILKLLSDPSANTDLLAFMNGYKGLLSIKETNTRASLDRTAKAKETIDENYRLPARTEALMVEVIKKIEAGGVSGIEDTLGDTRLDIKIQSELAKLTPQQKAVFASVYPGRIAMAFGDKGLKGDTANPYYVAEKLGFATLPDPSTVARMKQAEIDAIAPMHVGSKELNNLQNLYVKQINQSTNGAVQANLEGTRLTLIASGLQPVTQLTEEDLTITPPTEQDILERAAEYYRPYGTEEFKSIMAERDMQLVKRQEAKVKREQEARDKKVAEETAKQELLTRLPSWGGRALKVAGDAEALTGLSLEEINKKGQPEAFSVLMLRDEKYDFPGSIAKIDAEFDDPLDRQRALSVLMADNLNKHRAKKATEVDLIQEIEP